MYYIWLEGGKKEKKIPIYKRKKRYYRTQKRNRYKKRHARIVHVFLPPLISSPPHALEYRPSTPSPRLGWGVPDGTFFSTTANDTSSHGQESESMPKPTNMTPHHEQQSEQVETPWKRWDTQAGAQRGQWAGVQGTPAFSFIFYLFYLYFLGYPSIPDHAEHDNNTGHEKHTQMGVLFVSSISLPSIFDATRKGFPFLVALKPFLQHCKMGFPSFVTLKLFSTWGNPFLSCQNLPYPDHGCGFLVGDPQSHTRLRGFCKSVALSPSG